MMQVVSEIHCYNDWVIVAHLPQSIDWCTECEHKHKRSVHRLDMKLHRCHIWFRSEGLLIVFPDMAKYVTRKVGRNMEENGRTSVTKKC